jgi:hypothetical protein
MRSDGVVVDPLALDVDGQVEDVVDLFEEQPLVLQRPKPALSEPVLRKRSDPGSDVPELGMGGDERLEPEPTEPRSRRGSSSPSRPLVHRTDHAEATGRHWPTRRRWSSLKSSWSSGPPVADKIG